MFQKYLPGEDPHYSQLLASCCEEKTAELITDEEITRYTFLIRQKYCLYSLMHSFCGRKRFKRVET
jgi:hypothetical protein